jgi:hypothetical protein
MRCLDIFLSAFGMTTMGPEEIKTIIADLTGPSLGLVCIGKDELVSLFIYLFNFLYFSSFIRATIGVLIGLSYTS